MLVVVSRLGSVAAGAACRTMSTPPQPWPLVRDLARHGAAWRSEVCKAPSPCACGRSPRLSTYAPCVDTSVVSSMTPASANWCGVNFSYWCALRPAAARLQRLACSGPRVTVRSLSSWPRSHFSVDPMGSPHLQQRTSPVATSGCQRRRSCWCRRSYPRRAALGLGSLGRWVSQ